MGHYAAEMQCDKCGNLHCTCPSKKEKPNKKFIVADDYQVMTVDEFDTHLRSITSVNPLVYRVGKLEFEKREDAEVHARERCEAAIEKCRAQLTTLRNILKVQRPWERK